MSQDAGHKKTSRRLTDSEVDNLANEIDTAREIQSWLLPKNLPKIAGYDFDASYDPAEGIAGDYYDFFDNGRGDLGLLIADACGKGIPAALLMVHARVLFKNVTREVDSPADILRLVNAQFMSDVRAGTIVTAQYVSLNVKRNTLKVASAGHLPLFIFKSRSGQVMHLHPSGVPLGSSAPNLFDPSITQATVLLEPGDRFVMFTDGAFEIRNPKGEELGMEALTEAVRRHAQRTSSDFICQIMEDLKRFRGPARRADDITVVTGRYVPKFVTPQGE